MLFPTQPEMNLADEKAQAKRMEQRLQFTQN